MENHALRLSKGVVLHECFPSQTEVEAAKIKIKQYVEMP